MNTQLVDVAIAILYLDNRFLMQLRDNIPNIIYPGHWAFFGGHLDPGETPEVGLKRELQEEIGYTPPIVTFFGYYPDPNVMRHVFYAPLLVEMQDLVLGEGWDMGLITPDEIRKCECYSEKAGEVRPLSPRHQRILLDFMEKHSELVS